MDRAELVEGLYDALITSQVEARLEQAMQGALALAPDPVELDRAEEPARLARHLHDVALRELSSIQGQERIEVINEVTARLGAPGESLTSPVRRLTSLLREPGPGRPARYSGQPHTPLSETALLTNSPGEPSLGSEVRAELTSADQVDLLCAFVKWHGLRTLDKELTALAERGIDFRVITTTYMGATDRKALDALATKYGARVKVNYEIDRTRLHAKAWLFRRNTGFDTAYVGSSNLSRAALLDGVEWNVRLSTPATPDLISRFLATFDTYWNDAAFETYSPDNDATRLDRALSEASGRSRSDRVTISLSGLEIRPYPYQEKILQDIEAERELHGRHRNLVVAATGTGKTVIAALDYRRQCERNQRPTLLFVAHRKEILEQSLRTYREVLNDANFGELLVDGEQPEHWRHVFASVQSLKGDLLRRFPPDSFEVLVIDEFHHTAANSYTALLETLQPRELLGLTATPERADGKDVRDFFDGRVASELRLWDALSAELLTPFHYFGLSDGMDLSEVGWRNGGYNTIELTNLYTGNDARTRLILKQLDDKVAEVSEIRALGFCVGVEHAEYMATQFTKAGIPSVAVSGQTAHTARARARDDLVNRRVSCIFTADLYNEGIDIREVDTVLFLRPTESATIFLQQLGRGLRRSPDKDVLTVLDFVGHQHKRFRFEARYAALTGLTRRHLERAVTQEFPFLPSGCQIILDRRTEQEVLANIREQVSPRWAQITQSLRTSTHADLAGFLDETGYSTFDLFRPGRGWTRARRAAGRTVLGGSGQQEELLNRVAAFLHVDDEVRATGYRRLLDDDAKPYADLTPGDQQLARMLFFMLWPNGGQFTGFDDGLASLRAEPAVRDEICEAIGFAFDRARHSPRPLPEPLAQLPLRSHAHYTREEILAALDIGTLRNPPTNHREGVAYSENWKTDTLLVTLKKSDSDFSPSTMYQDYALAPELFHWESQSRTTTASPTGQRYLNHEQRGTNVLLFSRDQKKNELGRAVPYLLLGTAHHLSHRGEHPIQIEWRLDRAMPADHFAVARTSAP